MQNLTIDLGERSYPILIGEGLLRQPQAWQGLPRASTALIVSNETVAPLYAADLQAAITPHYGRVLTLVLPDGEAHKTWETLQKVFDLLLREGCDRKTVLFALGGGVIGDLTGFAAACFMRGVPFVQVPTTLLSQVDSSVGGKTAVNHPLGKNMIGAFYQPRLVIADTDTLKTLPDRELSAGIAEVIKYGLIPELVGRMPVVATLDELTEDALIQILTEPKNALIKQYSKLLAMEGAELEVRPSALLAIARKALRVNLSDLAAKAFTKQGIKLLTKAKVTEVTKRADGVSATIQTADGEVTVDAERVISAVGIVGRQVVTPWRAMATRAGAS